MTELDVISIGLITSGLFLSMSAIARNIGSMFSIHRNVNSLKKINLVKSGKARLKIAPEGVPIESFLDRTITEYRLEINRLNSAIVDRAFEFVFGAFLILFDIAINNRVDLLLPIVGVLIITIVISDSIEKRYFKKDMKLLQIMGFFAIGEQIELIDK